LTIYYSTLGGVYMCNEPNAGREFTGISDDELKKVIDSQRPNIALLGCGPMGDFYADLMEDEFYWKENVLFTIGEGDPSEFHPNRCVLSEMSLDLIRNSPEKFLKRGLLNAERKRIDGMLKDKNIVMLLGCGGDAIGAYLMPAVFDHLNKIDITTICLLTKPFSNKGEESRKLSETTLQRLRARPVHTMVVDMDRMEELVPGLPEKSKYRVGLEYPIRACKFLNHSTDRGLMNASLSEIQEMIQGSGKLYLGIGKSDSEDRYMDAFEEAMSSPVIDLNIEKVRRIMCKITGGPDLSIEGASEIIKRIENQMFCPGNLYIVYIDPCLEGAVEITVMASMT